jgi:hypothetical protein
MAKFTAGERLDMLGRKFVYYSADGTLKILGKVAGISPKIGMSLVAIDGAVNLLNGEPLDKFEDKNGTVCICMVNPAYPEYEEEMDRIFTSILFHGVYDCRGKGMVGWENPACPF